MGNKAPKSKFKKRIKQKLSGSLKNKNLEQVSAASSVKIEIPKREPLVMLGFDSQAQSPPSIEIDNKSIESSIANKSKESSSIADANSSSKNSLSLSTITSSQNESKSQVNSICAEEEEEKMPLNQTLEVNLAKKTSSFDSTNINFVKVKDVKSGEVLPSPSSKHLLLSVSNAELEPASSNATSLKADQQSLVNRLKNEETAIENDEPSKAKSNNGLLSAIFSTNKAKSNSSLSNEIPISVKSLSRISNKVYMTDTATSASTSSITARVDVQTSNSTVVKSTTGSEAHLLSAQNSTPRITISEALRQNGDLFCKLSNGLVNSREPIEINELDDSAEDGEATDDEQFPNKTATTTATGNQTAEVDDTDENESFDGEEENNKKGNRVKLTIRSSIAEGFNIFALDLFKRLCHTERKNLLISPFNIAQGLTLCYIGAQNKTEKQLDELLNISKLNKFKNLSKAQVTHENALLKKNLKQVKDSGNLLLLNRLFAPNKVNIKNDYAEKVRKYSSSIENLDFNKRVESSNAINEQISKKTNHRIKLIAEEDDLCAFGILSMNVAYFNGTWKQPFLSTNTTIEKFHVSSGKTENVEMMRQYSANYKYLENYQDLNASICVLPYTGKKFSIMIILPFDGISIASIESKLTTLLLRGVKKDLKYEKVNIAIPKFKVKHRFELSNDIIRMGAEDAFMKNKADLTLMAEDSITHESLYLTKFIHKTIFRVDVSDKNDLLKDPIEKIVVHESFEDKSKTVFDFTCNRPFLYIVRDNVNRILLFIGKYDKPLNDKENKKQND